ncbi:hypothetical protein ACJU26_01770 [Acidithiobacillus sp. M4-SHS-6]|uniref:hypothetical protein n=1 Tax=Acidithiobacillus sp. M4-SHS-6 TaxID=3383024 RepID=UPI0039BE9E16
MNIQKELHKATVAARFATLPDGTMLYKPVFGKVYYLVKNLDEKEKINKQIEFRQELPSVFFAVSLFFIFTNKWLGSEISFIGCFLSLVMLVVVRIIINKRMMKGLQPYTTDK